MAYNRKEEYLAVIKQPKEISDTLLETIDYIAKARDAELSFDKTIIAEVISLNNADTGEYFVEYQKGKFRAYAPVGLTYTYSKGTNVYVKIPGGDFTQKKTIEGKVSATSQTEEEYTALTQQIIDISEIFTDGNEYGVLAYAPAPTEEQESKYYEQVIYENKDLTEDVIFTSLLNTYPNIMISADFKTNFYGTVVAGNYGLKVEIEEKETGITYIRYLDITNFSGSIYGYDIYSPQYVIYDLSGLSLLGVKKITFFQERFLHYDEVKDSNDVVIKTYDSEPNIFVKNIKINIIDLQDSSKDLYYVGISAPQGLSLIQDTDKIKLTGVFYYANKSIMDEKNCKCYWYKLNPAILPGDSKYEQMAGAGWENITDSKDVNFNVLAVSGKDVYQQMWYKLIVVYNSSVTLSKEVRVVKYYNERFTLIRKDVSDTEVKITIVDSQEKVETADWYVDLLDGSYQPLAQGVSEVDVSKYLDYGDVIIYSVSKIDDNNYVPCQYQLKTYVQDAPVRVIFDGSDTFQYDKNGSITYDQSVVEFIIKPNVSVNKENIGVKSITWYSPDGGELFEYPTTKISNSMLTKLWVDKATNSLHYNIRQKFVNNYTNNTLLLKIITLADKEYLFTKSILFLKQGDYNVNGLDYSLTVMPCDSEGNEIKLQILNGSGNSYTPIYFKSMLRLNGNVIKDGYSYQGVKDDDKKVYKIQTSVEGINTTCEINKDIIKVSGITEDSTGQYFIKVLVDLSLDGDTNKKQLSYYQPIVVGNGIDNEKIGAYNIPAKITYYSDGTRSYNSSQPISFVYNNTELVNKNIESLTKDNLFINKMQSSTKEGEVLYYLVPSTKFTGAYFASPTDSVGTSPMGAISLTSEDKTIKIIYPIVMLNERDSLVSDIAIDDGTDISVVDEDNPEETKPLKPGWARGDFNKDNGSTIIGDGWTTLVKWRKEASGSGKARVLKNQDTSGYVSGIYQYDNDNLPMNVLRADGVVKLGGNKLTIDANGSINFNEDSLNIKNNSIQINEDIDSNILTITKLLNEIANNTDLKNQLSNYIAPKNIKLREWYTE